MQREAVVRLTARIVAAGVFLLLVAGALVTSTGSGLAVPDWPLSYGQLMPPMVGGIFYEHGHRMIAAAVSTLVGLQVAVLLWGERRPAVRRLGLVAFGAILLQAVLGGLTVLFLLPPAVSSAHAGLAQIVFAIAAAIALMTSRSYHEEELGRPLADSAKESAEGALRLTVIASLGVYVQILLGAVIRHTAAGLAIPDFPLTFGKVVPSASDLALRGVPIQLAHRIGALVVTVLVVAAARSLWRLSATGSLFPRLAQIWLGTLVVQLLLGAFSIWSRRAVAITSAHLAVGALCWVTGVLSAVCLARRLRLSRNLSSQPAGVVLTPHEVPA